jgi:hypothetical protein
MSDRSGTSRVLVSPQDAERLAALDLASEPERRREEEEMARFWREQDETRARLGTAPLRRPRA